MINFPKWLAPIVWLMLKLEDWKAKRKNRRP